MVLPSTGWKLSVIGSRNGLQLARECGISGKWSPSQNRDFPLPLCRREYVVKRKSLLHLGPILIATGHYHAIPTQSAHS